MRASGRPGSGLRGAVPGLLSLLLGDLGTDLVHVQALDAVDELLQRGTGQRAGLVEHQDAVAEGHQRGDRLDPGHRGELLLGLGVHLAERDVGVLPGGLLVDGRELLARTAPVRPEVDEHDLVVGDGLLEAVGGDGDSGHDCSPSGWGLPATTPHRLRYSGRLPESPDACPPMRLTTAVSRCGHQEGVPVPTMPAPLASAHRVGESTPGAWWAAEPAPWRGDRSCRGVLRAEQHWWERPWPPGPCSPPAPVPPPPRRPAATARSRAARWRSASARTSRTTTRTSVRS